MGIKYREDSNLQFLQFCDDDDLGVLVDMLTKSKNNKPRLTQQLFSEKRFIECNGQYCEVWDLIAGELQLFGGDTIVNTIRGRKGIVYKKLLISTCNKLKVNFNAKSDVSNIEMNLLLKIVEDSLEKMTEEEKREFASGLKLNVANLSSATIMAALQAAIRVGGFASYKIALIVANSIAKYLLGRGLTLAANAAITRWIAVFAGPVGWAISTILTLPMISGPAYRVVIPGVIQVAYMRQKYINHEIL